MADRLIRRGDVWMADFGHGRGHEQSGPRPGLIVSADVFNQGRSGLVIAIPLTTKSKGRVTHVLVQPPEGGLPRPSFIKCEDVRSISTERLGEHLGTVTPGTLGQVEYILSVLLDLGH